MSSNTFLPLPVPSIANAVGAAVDVSSLSPAATMVTDGPADSDGEVSIEISNDGGVNFASATESFPIRNPPSKILTGRSSRDTAEPYTGRPTNAASGLVAQFARVRRLTGSGPAFLALGSPAATDNLFATLGLSPVDTSAMGPIKTIVVSGAYDSVIVVEASIDGVSYDAIAKFDTKNGDVKYVIGTYAFMRLAAISTPPAVGSVSVGAGSGQVPGLNEGFLTEIVTNSSGTPLATGEAVRISGNDAVSRSRADLLPTVQGTIGLSQGPIPFPGTGPVVTEGKTRGLLQAGLVGVAAGQTLWISPTVAGRLTNVKPVFPNFSLCVGILKDATGVSDPTGPNDLAVVDVDPDCEPGVGASPSAGLGFGFFFANPVGGFAPIAIDAAIPFDSNGPASGGVIRSGVSPDTFVLPLPGVYDISWMVSVDEAGQLAVFLADGGPSTFVPRTLAGRATGTNQITNRVLIATANPGATIRIVNHSSAAALTLTPLPGGTSAGATSLVIVRLA